MINNKNIILLGFIVLKFVLQFFTINSVYELHRDEFLHLDQANHLAFGYTSVPPVTSWISIIIKCLGNTIFWIKFFPALFGALTIIIVWKTIEELKGSLFALILASTCLTFSVLVKLNALYQPNSLDVLCWTSLFFFSIKYINTQNNKFLYLLALAFTIGFLNKYNIVFLIIGLLPAILLSQQRKVLLNKHLYIAFTIALICILPNLIWQYNNNFIVFKHLKELTDTQLVNVKRSDFLYAQLSFFNGSFALIALSLYALITQSNFKKYSYLAWSFFFTIGIFTFFKAKSYYAIGLYPIFFSFGAIYLDKLIDNKTYLKPVVIIFILACFIPVYQYGLLNKTPQQIINNSVNFKKTGLLTWEDGKQYLLPQDNADMLGWVELSKKVDSLYQTIDNKNQTLIICDNYGQAGAINFYTKQQIKAVSFNADYLYWFDLSKKYKNIILVKNAWETHTELKKTTPLFHKSFIHDKITHPYARENGTTILCFLNAKVNLNLILKQEIEKRTLPLL